MVEGNSFTTQKNESTRECDCCGRKFSFRVGRGRPRKFCCKTCYKNYQREIYIPNWVRKKRAKRKKNAQRIYRESHQQIPHLEHEAVHTLVGPRIDREHDQWDFIPATENYPAANTIGTLTDDDLTVIETKDGPRILAAVRLEKKKHGKNGKRK